jgi:hypothetical protein
MSIQFEHTDTFGGEANYCWVRRAYLTKADSVSDRALVRRAKAWAGLTGIPARVDRFGDTIAIYPRGICHVLFVNYCEPSDVEPDKVID